MKIGKIGSSKYPTLEYFTSAQGTTLVFTIPGVAKPLAIDYLEAQKNQGKASNEIAEYIAKSLKGTKMRFRSSVDVFVLGDCVFMAALPLPKTSAFKVANFVKNDLRDRFGGSFEKDFYYTTKLTKMGQGGVLAISALVKKAKVDEINAILKGANLSSRAFYPGSLALRSGSGLKNRDISHKGVFVFVKDSFTSINLIYDAAILSYAALPHGYSDYVGKAGKAALDDLNRELLSLVGENYFGLEKTIYPTLTFFARNSKVTEAYGTANPLDLSLRYGGGVPAYYPDRHLAFRTKTKSSFLGGSAKGFTLAEVLVSLVMFAIAGGAITGTVLSINQFNRDKYDQSQAAYILSDISERMLVDPSGELQHLSLPNDADNSYSGFVYLTMDGDGYKPDGTAAAYTYALDCVLVITKLRAPVNRYFLQVAGFYSSARTAPLLSNVIVEVVA